MPPNAETSIWNVIEKAALSADEELELKNYTEVSWFDFTCPHHSHEVQQIS